ncbi:hypothetical protein [Lysobacter antibioticus]|uniref:hypothetical protein n=1 Tax=Lysobacter antibioticus TaxID=84531 RepID=UPI00118765DF|nr:hypothetical protein [Lysobacter antibioticus]
MSNPVLDARLRTALMGLEKGAKLGLIGVLALNLLLLVYYLIYGYQVAFHSDSAAKNLLAQEIYDTGRLFPTDWTYVNGDLMVVFGQWFIVPFLSFFANGYKLHALSGAISSLLILLSVWLASRLVTPSRWIRLFCVALIAGALSLQGAENLYGQVSYGVVFSLACFLLYFTWRYLAAIGSGVWIWGLAIWLHVALVSFSNPQRALASYLLPLFGALIIDALVKGRAAGWRWDSRLNRSLLCILILISALAVGMVLHAAVLSGVNNLNGASVARWLSFEGLIRNFWLTLRGALEILGVVPQEGGLVASMVGAGEALRLVSGLTLLVLIPVASAWGVRESRAELRLFAAFTAVSLALFFFLQMTTTIADMSQPAYASRYLVPSLFLAIMLVVGWAFSSAYHARAGQAAGVAVLVLLLLSSSIWPSHPFSQALRGRDEVPLRHMARMLESNGLKYGYGTYWNAGAITVFSDSKAKVRQISIEQGLPMPMYHLSSERWYRPEAWQGASFLLLSDAEAKAVNWLLLESMVGKPVRIYRHDQYAAYLFSGNIAKGLRGWDRHLDRPLQLLPTANGLRNTGQLVNISGLQAVEASGQSGYLAFGPYITLSSGVYEATFDVEGVGDAANGFGVVDVFSGNRIEHAMRGVTGSGRQRIALRFTLNAKVSSLEVRVRSSGAGVLRWYGTVLKRVGDIE